jgi:hypothetical protein
MKTLARLLDHSINRSPAENFRRLKAIFRAGSADFLYDLETVLRTPWYLNETLHIDRFFRYQRVVRNQIRWEELDFRDTTTLEFGCGPLLGWGPMAVYLGCSHYVCVEPRFDDEVLRSKEMEKRYLVPLHEQLEANFRKGVPYKEFKRRILDHLECYTTPLESFDFPEHSVDLVVSNGVLQHIMDLHGCLKVIKRISRPASRQFHVQHFTDHAGNTERPFKEIYTRSPEDYFKSNTLCNLKRPSEMVTLFEQHGIKVKLVPYLWDEAVFETPDRYWKQFKTSDLCIRVAFLVS